MLTEVSAGAKRINTVIKIVVKLVFTQMTYSQSNK